MITVTLESLEEIPCIIARASIFITHQRVENRCIGRPANTTKSPPGTGDSAKIRPSLINLQEQFLGAMLSY
jgi:proline racemase